jgi:hypothetical protein
LLGAEREVPVAVEQSSGRDRLNIHGAIDLETGQTIMKDVLTVDALSTIVLLMAIEAMYTSSSTMPDTITRNWCRRYRVTRVYQETAKSASTTYMGRVQPGWLGQKTGLWPTASERLQGPGR